MNPPAQSSLQFWEQMSACDGPGQRLCQDLFAWKAAEGREVADFFWSFSGWMRIEPSTHRGSNPIKQILARNHMNLWTIDLWNARIGSHPTLAAVLIHWVLDFLSHPCLVVNHFEPQLLGAQLWHIPSWEDPSTKEFYDVFRFLISQLDMQTICEVGGIVFWPWKLYHCWLVTGLLEILIYSDNWEPTIGMSQTWAIWESTSKNGIQQTWEFNQ